MTAGDFKMRKTDTDRYLLREGCDDSSRDRSDVAGKPSIACDHQKLG